MKTPLFFTGSSSANVSNSADRYAPLAAGGTTISAWGTSGASGPTTAVRMATAGTISTLRVRFPTTISQGTYTLTLMKGSSPTTMVATSLSVTIGVGTGPQDVSDLVNTVSVADGDYVAWRCSPSGTPTAQAKSVQVSCVFDATTSGHSPIISFMGPTAAANFGPLGAGTGAGGTEAISMVVSPIAFTMGRMQVVLSTAPGTGNTRTVTIRKGSSAGTLADTTLTVTFGATDTEKTIDLGGSPVSVSVGDFLVISHAITGTPASAVTKIAIDSVPAVSGQAARFNLWGGSLSTSAVRYGVAAGTSGTAEADETNTAQLAPANMTVKAVRADTTTAPGSGKSRAFTLRKNGTDTALTTTISNTATSNTTTTDVTYSGGDTIDFGTTPTSTPTASAWSTVSSIMEVSTGAPAINFSPSDRAGQTFEGIRNTSKVQVGGAYSGTPTQVQVRLVDGSGNAVTGFDWTAATTASGGSYAHTFTGVPVGGPYYQQVRDNGGTSTASLADLYVGAVVVLWGQSQCQKLHTADVSGLTPNNGMQVRILTYSSQNDVSTASSTITKFDSSTVGLALKTGSGVVALAHQWHADTGGAVPLMIVTCAYQGTSIEYWVDDRRGDFVSLASPGTDVTTLWGTSPTTGFAWFMAAAAKYQASAIVMMQGTADVNQRADIASAGAGSAGSGHDYSWFMDALKAKFEALYNALTNLPLFLVVPHQRSDDGNYTWAMRNDQYAKAVSGGTWRLCCWLLDWQMDSDGSPHQATGATGNIRGGTRIGRGIAKHLNNTALDIAGPQISTCKFTDATRNVIEIVFSGNIELADGTAYAGAPVTLNPQLFAISTNSGSTFDTPGNGFTAAITAANKVRLTKTTGSWVNSTTRVDYLRGTPFASDSAVTDYVGAESAMETSYLSRVITDTSSFDGGRGMPMAPLMGTGLAVTESNTYGPLTIAVADSAAGTASLAPFTITVT